MKTSKCYIYYFTVKPEFNTDTTHQIEMAETEIQTLKLSPSGNNITYTLYKDGLELNSSSISINDGVFTMPVGNKSDIGTYVLKAENAGGLTFHNFTVNVTCEIFIIFLLTIPHLKNQLNVYS